jgi:predicted CXXCH cytochrome family protein
VKSRILLGCLVVLLAQRAGRAQSPADVLGMHNLSPGSGSPIVAQGNLGCTFCHAPHSGLSGTTPLWNHTLSKQTYTAYTSPTYHQQARPPLGRPSSQCLSCHDGTVAVGQSVVYGKIQMTGSMNSGDVLGTNLSGSHPFSLVTPLKDSPDMAASLVAQGRTADPLQKVRLQQGNVECTSCHNPHVQCIDMVAGRFLVRDSSYGALCLACHDPDRTMQGQTNPLAGWPQSAHATSATGVQNLLYSTVALNACFSCHTDHNALGAEWLLRGAGDQVCLTCHACGVGGAPPGIAAHNQSLASTATASPQVSPALNVGAEYAKVGHPLTTGNDDVPMEALNKNKAQPQSLTLSTSQSACVGCHDPHSAQPVTHFTAAPAVRASQTAVAGVSDKDGMTLLKPAQSQFEICLRCHGPSLGKTIDTTKYGYMPARLATVADPRNVVPEFSAASVSSHPVTHVRRSPLPQPSLLLSMWNLNGTTPGRATGNQIFCTDCHNSDDNREFGGNGPNGPHGSAFAHILERRYEFSQAPAPGRLITNLFPNPSLSAQGGAIGGPYALCAKCHDLAQILNNSSFSEHARHVKQDGFSCSVCHTAHGVGAQPGNISGERLVNFDVRVVAPNGGAAISYNRATNSCSLVCHDHVHRQQGTARFGRASIRR